MPVTDWSDSIVIADLSDEPALSEDLDALCRRMDERPAERDGGPDVILNLQQVTYLNSSNLAQLLKLRKKVMHNQRRLRLCAVSDSVWSVLLTTGLDGLFTFTEDVSTSLASLQIE